MKTTKHVVRTDEAIVDSARRTLASKRKVRWVMLLYAIFCLGFFGHILIVAKQKIEGSDTEWLQMGFCWGFAIAVMWMLFGLAGSLCLGKFIRGFEKDFPLQELLVRYHDRLRDLGQLPDEKKIEK